MRSTQRKGDIATAKAIATFTELGYDVSVPITESAQYDLIVDDGFVYKVQVKYCSGMQVDLRRIHSNSKGYIVQKYEKNSFDWLFIYRPNGDEYLLKTFPNNSTINLKAEWKIPELAKDIVLKTTRC